MIDIGTAKRVLRLADQLRPLVAEPLEPRFIHDDIHPMNIMCSSTGELLAIIDWGDAGWGDPGLDFATIPFDVFGSALAGYEAEAPDLLGARPLARIAWHRLLDAADNLLDSAEPLDLEALRRLARVPER